MFSFVWVYRPIIGSVVIAANTRAKHKLAHVKIMESWFLTYCLIEVTF